MKRFAGSLSLSLVLAVLLANIAGAATVLYVQDFENPTGFVNDRGDVNLYNSVNMLYGNQPSGFTFAQQFSIETLLITGTRAFGHGYSDPAGIGGNYCLGMLADLNSDLLGLAFNVGNKQFLNLKIDISSIDLSVFGGPFVFNNAIPRFEFTLFDNPSGVVGLTGPTTLDVKQVSGVSSARDVFVWTEAIVPLDASGNTNGNVILRIDLLSGGYAAFDNMRIAAADIPGDLGTTVPEPSSLIIGATIVALCVARRRPHQRLGQF